MGYKIISRAISVVLFVTALIFAASLGIQAFIAFNVTNIAKWAICLTITLAAAAFLAIFSQKFQKNIFKREALAIIGLGWIAVILFGMLPYLFLIDNCSFVDAFFESASGFTTTGASVFGDLKQLPRSLIFYRGITQWIGGFGTIFFFAILLPIFGEKSKSICMSGLSLGYEETTFANTKTIIRYVLGIYLALTSSSAIVYYFGGMAKLDALCYAFSVTSTGGFSTPGGEKILSNSSPLQYFTVVVMIISGMNFISGIKSILGKKELLDSNEEFRWYLTILAISTIAVTLALQIDENFSFLPTKFRHALFHITSVMTTTGLSIEDYSCWPIMIKIILLLLMLCGSCSGSTAGGLKVVRIAVACKICLRSIKKAFRQNLISPIFFEKKHLTAPDIEEVLSYITLVCLLLPIMSLALSITIPDSNFFCIIATTLSNFCNIGVEAMDFGSTIEYANIGGAAKSLCALIMIIGRVEIYAILVLFFPSFWKKFA